MDKNDIQQYAVWVWASFQPKEDSFPCSKKEMSHGLEMEGPATGPGCSNSSESQISIHLFEQGLGISISSEIKLWTEKWTLQTLEHNF